MAEFVRVRDCACPETPHAEEGDGVFLRPTLSANGGILAEQMLVAGFADQDDLMRRLLPPLVRSEATGANFMDPFDVEAILDDWRLARPVILRAGELYLDAVVAPLVPTPSKASRTGRTTGTTSARRAPTPEPSA